MSLSWLLNYFDRDFNSVNPFLELFSNHMHRLNTGHMGPLEHSACGCSCRLDCCFC